MKFKLNTVPIDPLQYIAIVRGEPKVGKTSLAKELIKQVLGSPEKGLLLAVGTEIGYTTMSDIQAEPVQNWAKLDEVKKELFAEKDKRTHGIEFVVIDTADELYKIAEQAEIDKHNKLNPSSQQNSVNGIFGGYGNGHLAVNKRVKSFIAELRANGYGVMVLEHTKFKNVKDPDGDYEVVTSNLDPRYSQALASIADIITVLRTVRTTDSDGKLVKSTRKMFFRNTGWVDAGSRFASIRESIDAGKDATEMAKNYITVVREAISNASNKPVSVKEEEQERNEVSKKKSEEAVNEVESLLATLKDKKTEYAAKKAEDESLPTFNSIVLGIVPDFLSSKKKLQDLSVDEMNQIISQL